MKSSPLRFPAPVIYFVCIAFIVVTSIILDPHHEIHTFKIIRDLCLFIVFAFPISSILYLSKTARAAKSGFPRVWDLFAFALPRKIRDETYEPYHQELLEDYIVARKYRGKFARRWLALCFATRTLVLVLQCYYVWLGERGGRWVLGLIGVIFGKQAIEAMRYLWFFLFRRF